jgi:hypothetical protein
MIEEVLVNWTSVPSSRPSPSLYLRQRVAVEHVPFGGVVDQVVVGIAIARVGADLRFLVVGQSVAVGIGKIGIAGHLALLGAAVAKLDGHHPAALLGAVGQTVAVHVDRRIGRRAREDGRRRIDDHAGDDLFRPQGRAGAIGDVDDGHAVHDLVLRARRQLHPRAVVRQAGGHDQQRAGLRVHVLLDDDVVRRILRVVRHRLAERHGHAGIARRRRADDARRPVVDAGLP